MRTALRRVAGPAGAAALATGLVLALAAPTSAAAPPARTPDPAHGRQLYLTACSSCHGMTGDGTPTGPSLRRSGAAGVDFYLSTGRMPLDKAVAQAERRRPVYGPADIADLVAYYVSAIGSGPAIPAVDVAAGDLARGASLYADNCAACHGSGGAGGALGGSYHAPALRDATALQVAEAVRTGPGPMPVFGPGTLDQHQLESIVRYVGYLQHPVDRGGYGLGHLGPIPEGFAGWFIGLGTLLLAVRFIGTSE
jgi:ubiquinol-cytochrome c reductase cytochrome c subunit